MNFSVAELTIPGCFELRLPCFPDDRGEFTKLFHRDTFAERGLETRYVESFVTTSRSNVLRGMHFQLPPADQVKIVYCLTGSAQDVLLDLRKGSPTFGQHAVLELDARKHHGVYVPRGVAHGFCVRDAPAVMMYVTSSQHAPNLDTGIAWDSFGAPWALSAPQISARDASFPRFADFDSPFCYLDTARVQAPRPG